MYYSPICNNTYDLTIVSGWCVLRVLTRWSRSVHILNGFFFCGAFQLRTTITHARWWLIRYSTTNPIEFTSVRLVVNNFHVPLGSSGCCVLNGRMDGSRWTMLQECLGTQERTHAHTLERRQQFIHTNAIAFSLGCVQHMRSASGISLGGTENPFL